LILSTRRGALQIGIQNKQREETLQRLPDGASINAVEREMMASRLPSCRLVDRRRLTDTLAAVLALLATPAALAQSALSDPARTPGPLNKEVT
jgi:hypothetical protein